MQPVWLSGRQNGRIGHGLHHNEGSLPGRDGDTVRAFGVLIADAQRVARREGRIGQLVVGAAFADALGPALHGEDGKVEKFLFRVTAFLTGADEGDAAALVLEGDADAPLFQPKAGAEVRQRVLQPFAAQRPQQQYLGKPFSEASFAAYSVSVSSLTWGRMMTSSSCAGQGAVSKSPTMMFGLQPSGSQLR